MSIWTKARKYQEIAPNNMVYDLSAKCYRRSETFQRVWK